MRLRLKLTLLLGLIFSLAFAGLVVYDSITQTVGDIIEEEARPHANMSVSTLALSIRGQEIFSLLVDLESAVGADEVQKSLQLLGAIERKTKERQSLLRSVHPGDGENPVLAALLLRREEIVERERILLDALARDLSAARDRDERLERMHSFMKGEYVELEKERRTRAEAIAGLALAETAQSFDDIDGALERSHNLYTATILTLLMSFGFVLFFISKRMVRPIEQIAQTIEQISMGKLEAEVPPELKGATDEIGRLARAFDRTIMSLKMSMRGQGQKEGKPRVK